MTDTFSLYKGLVPFMTVQQRPCRHRLPQYDVALESMKDMLARFSQNSNFKTTKTCEEKACKCEGSHTG